LDLIFIEVNSGDLSPEIHHMSDKKKLTLKDIAKALGISISTASRALQGHPDIAKETIQTVKAYAEKNNYVPNFLAVNFRKSRTFNIGLIVPELVHHFFSTVISGAIDTAKKLGYNVLVSQSNDVLQDEVIACRTMLSSSVDGLLISISNETVEGKHIQDFLDEKKPVIQFDKITDELPTPKVIVDDREGAFVAVTHLVDQGYKKIAHIRGRMEVKNASERYDGYKKALEERELSTKKEWIKVCHMINEEEGYEFARELMESADPPDAIFCITDLVALGVLRYLKEKNIAVPEQVGVIGFSNWKLAEIVSPSLSSVDQHGYNMGVMATQLLIERIQNQEVGKDETFVLKTRLITRESSQPQLRNRI
jgi:LacI family transcriptional regulator